jgi:hypothetical protein
MAEDYLPAERETSMNKSDKIIITLIVFLGLIAIFGIVWHYNESIEVTVKTALATNTIMPGDTRTVTVTQFQPVSNEVTRFMTKTAMVTETREVPVTITVPFTVYQSVVVEGPPGPTITVRPPPTTIIITPPPITVTVTPPPPTPRDKDCDR